MTKKFVDEHCKFTKCKNRDNCIKDCYICPAATLIETIINLIDTNNSV